MFGLYFFQRGIYMHLTEIKQLLTEYDANALKKYGQNFLIDDRILKAISNSLNNKTNSVIEIGPGLGSLTRFLVQDYTEVMAYEIDPKMVKVIKNTLPSVKVIEGDFLKQDVKKDIKEYLTTIPSIISNLPYYITTPIIMKILEELDEVNYFTLMMQKEVASRIIAKHGNKDYGSLSILLQVYFEIAKVIDVSPHAFYPEPDVSSTVLKFERRIEPLYTIKNHESFKQITKLLFAQRRKTIYNNLKTKYSKDQIEMVLNQLQITPNKRSEELPIEVIVKLCNLLS